MRWTKKAQRYGCDRFFMPFEQPANGEQGLDPHGPVQKNTAQGVGPGRVYHLRLTDSAASSSYVTAAFAVIDIEMIALRQDSSISPHRQHVGIFRLAPTKDLAADKS